jgi:signal transduction histidine kinase
MSVRAKLFGLVAFVALVPLAAFAWTALSTHQAAYDQALFELQQQQAEQAKGRASGYLSGMQQTLERLARHTIKWGDLDEEERNGALWLLYQQAPEIVAVSLLDARGERVGESVFHTRAAAAGGHALADRAMVQEHERRAWTHRNVRGWGTPFQVAGQTYLPIAFPVTGADGAAWTATVTLSTRQLCELNSGTQATETHIVDRSGRALCNGLRAVGTPAPDRPLMASVDGQPVVRAGAKLQDGWHIIVEQPAAALLEPRRRMLGQTALWLVLSACGAVFGGIYLARAISGPVDTLVHAASEIGRGNYTHRVLMPAEDEYGRLASALNDMGAEIAFRDDKIRGFNARLQRGISEKAEELQTAHGRLLQTQKLAATATLGLGVAQEVNNPLTSVLGIVQLLRERVSGDPARSREHELLSSAESEAKRIRDIVKRLLGMSQREDAAHFKHLSAASLVSATLSLVERDAERCRVHLDQVVGTDTDILGNFSRLQQALLEVVDNAIFHCPAGGTVRLVAVRRGGDVVLSVWDNGAGMSAEIAANAREPFFTTRVGTDAKGLGLAIAHRIVEDHGGRLEIESEPGNGSTVSLCFPCIARPDGVACA